MSRKHLILPALAILLLISTWLAWVEPDSGINPLNRDGGTQPDYYLTELVLDSFAADGRLEHTLKAKRAVHHAGQGTQLELPRITLSGQQGSPWQITAQAGHISEDGQLITLSGRVDINRLATPNNPPMTMRTRDLRFRQDTGMAESDEAVTVVSDQTRLRAIGFRAKLQEPSEIQFLSQVRAQYVP